VDWRDRPVTVAIGVALMRSYPAAVRLLLANQFGVNFGFYLVLPYLAAYLTGDLAMSVATVGLVLGVRTLSQQGMTVFGGSAADRLGNRPLIMLGCGLRVIGFGLFALADSLAGILLASVLIGVAGALFSPACRAYLAQAAGDRRLDAFAAFHTASNAGALLGPLTGALLLIWDFRLVAAAAALVFLLMTIAQALALPPQPGAGTGVPRPSVMQGWRLVLSDFRFLAFLAAMCGLFLAYNQLYLLLPLEAVRVTGFPGISSLIFIVATAVGLLASIPLTRWLAPRWGRARSIAAGATLCGLAFVPTAVSASTQHTADSRLPVPDLVWQALPVLAATALLALGYALALPLIQDVTTSFARGGLTATYLGMSSTVAGVVAAGGNVFVGWLHDAAGGAPWLPWVFLALLQLTGAGLLMLLHRRGVIPAPGPPGRAAASVAP
jgi:MFS family permease